MTTDISTDMGTAPDRRPSLLVAAGVLVLVVVGAVLVFGVERPPSVASVTDDPPFLPPAPLAWSAWDDGEQCLFVLEPDGEAREVACADRGEELLGWTDEGIIVRDWSMASERVVAVDPVTGERTPSSSTPSPDGSELERPPAHGGPVQPFTDRDDGTLTVTLQDTTDPGGDGTVIWEVEAPDSYDVTGGVRSPDGSAIALHDTADRLLVAPTDGSASPRRWAEDLVPSGSFVWEGTDPDR